MILKLTEEEQESLRSFCEGYLTTYFPLAYRKIKEDSEEEASIFAKTAQFLAHIGYLLREGKELYLSDTELELLGSEIELSIFDYIRNDKSIDNIVWLIGIISVYKKLNENFIRRTGKDDYGC